MVELLSLLRRLLYEPPHARLDFLQMRIRNANRFQLPIVRGHCGFGH